MSNDWKNDPSLTKLNDWIKNNVFTSRDNYGHTMICKGYSYSDNEEDENLLDCVFKVYSQDVTYPENGSPKVNDYGQEFKQYDYTKPTVVETFPVQDVIVSYPKDILGLYEDENGKRKTAIYSARYAETEKFYANSFSLTVNHRDTDRLDKIRFKFFEKNNKKERVPVFKVAISPWVDDSKVVSLQALLKYYDLYDKPTYWQNKLGMKETYKDIIESYDTTEDTSEMSDDIYELIKSLKVNRNALNKFEILSEGAFKVDPDMDYLNKPLLDFICANFFVDVRDHEELNKTNSRTCDKYCEKTPLDYQFMNVLDAVRYDLESYQLDNYHHTYLARLKMKMYQTYVQKVKSTNTISRNITGKYVQAAINRFFRMQTENFRDVQTTKDSNALTLLSQSRTIHFYDKKDADGKVSDKWEQQRVSDIRSFNGIIDPVRSSDSAQINKHNELAIGTNIDKDNQITIDVIEIKTGKVVSLDFVTFSKSKILTRDCYDLDSKTVHVSRTTGKYSILQYFSYKLYDELPDDVIYTRSRENELSYATAMLPFTNRMVATRDLLSGHFLDQSIPVDGAKPTAVHTKMSKKLYEISQENTKYNGEETLKVLDVKGQYIKAKGVDSGKVVILGKPYGFRNTSMATTNKYIPVVKAGDTIKTGQIIETSNAFHDGEYTTQVPLYVMFGTYFGKEHEDGIILTKKAAKKFAHITDIVREEYGSIYKFYGFKRRTNEDDSVFYKRIPIINTKDGKKKLSSYKNIEMTLEEKQKADPTLRSYNLDEWSLVKPGSMVTAGSLLFQYYTYDREEVLGGTGFDEILGGGYRDISQQLKSIRVPYNVRGQGIVKEVHLYINDDPSLFEGINEEVLTDRQLMAQLVDSDDKLSEENSKVTGSFGVHNTENKEALEHFRKIGEDYERNLAYWKTDKLPRRTKDLWKVKDENHSWELQVVIEYADELTDNRLGAKLSNFYASKGVNVYLIPDEYAPRDEFGNEIEGVISTGTTWSRQNPGQADECKLGLICKELAKRILANPKAPTADLDKILNLVYPKGYKYSQLVKDSREYGYCRIEVDYFDEYYVSSKISQIFKAMKLTKFRDQYNKPYIEGKSSKKVSQGLSERGDCKVYFPELGKWSEYDMTVGLTSMMRLHFIQEHKATVSPDIDKSVFDDDDNVNYAGSHREGGQKMGQMEIMAEANHGEMELLSVATKQKGRTSKGANYNSALMAMNFRGFYQ